MGIGAVGRLANSTSARWPATEFALASAITKVRQSSAPGIRYFQHMVIIWSMRKRGSVQRSQIMPMTPITALQMKLASPSKLPSQPATVLGSPESPTNEARGMGPF